MQYGCIVANTHAAPVHRLDLHRPERLNGAVAHVRAQSKATSSAPFLHRFARFKALLAAQFRLIFHMLTSSVLAGQVGQPAIDRSLRQAALPQYLVRSRPLCRHASV